MVSAAGRLAFGGQRHASEVLAACCCYWWCFSWSTMAAKVPLILLILQAVFASWACSCSCGRRERRKKSCARPRRGCEFHFYLGSPLGKIETSLPTASQNGRAVGADFGWPVVGVTQRQGKQARVSSRLVCGGRQGINNSALSSENSGKCSWLLWKLSI